MRAVDILTVQPETPRANGNLNNAIRNNFKIGINYWTALPATDAQCSRLGTNDLSDQDKCSLGGIHSCGVRRVWSIRQRFAFELCSEMELILIRNGYRAVPIANPFSAVRALALVLPPLCAAVRALSYYSGDIGHGRGLNRPSRIVSRININLAMQISFSCLALAPFVQKWL